MLAVKLPLVFSPFCASDLQDSEQQGTTGKFKSSTRSARQYVASNPPVCIAPVKLSRHLNNCQPVSFLFPLRSSLYRTLDAPISGVCGHELRLQLVEKKELQSLREHTSNDIHY